MKVHKQCDELRRRIFICQECQFSSRHYKVFSQHSCCSLLFAILITKKKYHGCMNEEEECWDEWAGHETTNLHKKNIFFSRPSLISHYIISFNKKCLLFVPKLPRKKLFNFFITFLLQIFFSSFLLFLILIFYYYFH
jgi:hypothetical protein